MAPKRSDEVLAKDRLAAATSANPSSSMVAVVYAMTAVILNVVDQQLHPGRHAWRS
jgi:hypothetical protein